MAITTSSGIGSGIDIRGLVDDLLKNESTEKIKKFDKDEATALSKITGYGNLKSALSEFQTAVSNLKDISSFQKRTATTEDSDIFTATASTSASPSSYDIEVTQLARAQKLTSQDFNNANAVVGTGTLTFDFGTISQSIEITSTNQTLSGIRDTINESSNALGVTASIINVDSGSRLVLSSNKTGLTNAFTVSVDDDDGDDSNNAGLSQLASANLTTTVAALDATVNLNGSEVTSSSNTFEDAIDGVSFTVLDTNVGEAKELSVSLDKNSINGLVAKFVSSYNESMDLINDLTKYQDNGPEAVTGTLLGDATVRNLQIQIRRELNSRMSVTGVGFSTLAQVGITTDDKTGKLILSNTKLTEAIDSNFDAIGDLFAKDEEGVAIRLDNVINNFVKTDGILDTRTQGLNQSINNISKERVDLERYLKSLEERLLNQFFAMDALIAQFNSTSDFLTQQLANLPKPLSFKK